MSTDKNSDQFSNNQEPNMDDYGIDHDRMIELCEMVIKNLHENYVINRKPLTNPQDAVNIMEAVSHAWFLTQDILDLNNTIRNMINEPGTLLDDEEGEEDEDGQGEDVK